MQKVDCGSSLLKKKKAKKAVALSTAALDKGFTLVHRYDEAQPL